MKTLIVNIKRNSLDDGPGIRTVIFFKGCPLSCVWCQNPETKSQAQEISFEPQNCIECKECIDVCKLGAINFSSKYRIDRELCNLCGDCIDICKGEAISFAGREYTTDELLRVILKDKPFYDNSGGGITLTGGEPILHMNYLHELLTEVKKYNIHVCLETCGYYNEDTFNKLILPLVDLIYFDLKLLNDELHKEFCRVSNDVIKKNFEKLISEKSTQILPRIPLIPKITATRYNLLEFATYLKSLNITKIGLLPYNPLWLSKAEVIGADAEYKHSKWMSEKEKQIVKEIFSDFEFRDF